MKRRITYTGRDILGIVISQEWVFSDDATIPETVQFAGVTLTRRRLLASGVIQRRPSWEGLATFLDDLAGNPRSNRMVS